MRRLTLIVAVLATIGAGLPASAAPKGDHLVPVVIRLVDHHPDPAGFGTSLVANRGGGLGFVYRHAIKGFSAELPEAAIAALGRNPQVLSVTPDEVVVSIAANAMDIPTGYDRIEADLVPRSASTTDVDIAILDTGVRLYHPDLNVVMASDCTASLFGQCSGGGTLDDDHGHGSHVAGTAAAKANGVGTTGVASGARIWSVKVLDSTGNGLLSWIVAGVDAVTEFAADIEVANMSFAGEFSDQTFDAALANSVDAGVFYTAAAGNSATDAATFSPANHPDVMTVSAVSDGDGAGGALGVLACRDGETEESLATFSNYGAVVDMAAPGSCIYSTWNDDGYRMASGTSMAAPHVAGAAALYIAETGRDQDGNGIVDGADVAAVGQALLSNAIPQNDVCGFGGDIDGYPEPLLWLNGGLLGGNGECTIATPDATGPAPTAVVATADGFNVDLSWSDSDDPESGLLSYIIERDGIEVAEVDAHATTFRDEGLSPATAYDYTVTARNRQGLLGSPTTESVTTSGDDPSKVAHFTFDDGVGTRAWDSSGWRRHGSLINGPAWTAGMLSGSLQFDGNDDRVDFAAASLDGADDVTAAFWLRTSHAGAQSIISAANSTNSNEFFIYLVDSTHLRLYVGTTETQGVEWVIPSIADGQWHHLAVVRNSGPEHAYLYLDGEYFGGWLVTTGMEPLEVAAALIGQDQDTVGGGFDPNQALTGELDDVQIFNRVLSDAEIAALAAGPSNSPPDAVDDVASTFEDSGVVVDVLVNDSDVDGDVLVVDSVVQPLDGVVVLNPDDTVSYTPDPDFNGSDSFTYTVSDGNGGLDTATVTVTVDAVNDVPVAGSDAYGATEDIPLFVAAPGVLGNDSDVDGDALSAVVVVSPANGLVTLNGDGSFTYTPDQDFNGSDSFTYVANDGTVDSNMATVTVTVDAVNDVPVADAGPDQSVIVDDVVQLDGSSSSDVDGDPLTYAWAVDSAPAGSAAGLSDPAAVMPQFTPDVAGDYVISLTVDDGTLSSTDTMTIQAGSTLQQFAQSETTVVGSRSGDMTALDAADGILEELTESHSGGKPQNRVSRLDHRWTFEVEPGDQVSIHAVAHRSSSSDDNFVFEYSTDGGANFSELFVVDVTSPGTFEQTLPPGTSGQVVVRVRDTDRTPGNSSTDTLYVDRLVIETVNPDTTGGGGTYEFRALSESTRYGTVVSGDYTSTFELDGQSEEVVEELYAGNKKTRLEHTWTFDTTQSGLTLHVAATTGAGAAEGFSFSYSTNGSDWTELQVLLDGSLQSIPLSADDVGTIYVRVNDDDQSRNETNLDSVIVDVLYLSSAS